jgi:hypothetical protein
LSNVRSQEYTGRHLLMLSSSDFDPKRSSAAANYRARLPALTSDRRAAMW